MMRKWMAFIPAAVLAVGVWTGTASAQTAGRPGAPAENAGCRFVDSNGDGICDNRGSEQCLHNGTGNGHCDGNGRFIDADNDGVCDNYADGTCPQHGGRNPRNRGMRFGGHRQRR